MENHTIPAVAAEQADRAQAIGYGDIPKANTALGLSRSHSHPVAQREGYPAKIHRFGGRQRVVPTSFVRLLSENSESGSP